MSCLKTNRWSSTGKILPRTRSKTRPRRCIHIVSCSSHLEHRCRPRFASRSEGTFSICRASSLVNGYLCYSRTLFPLSLSHFFLLVFRMLYAAIYQCFRITLYFIDHDPDLALLFFILCSCRRYLSINVSPWIILVLATYPRGSILPPFPFRYPWFHSRQEGISRNFHYHHFPCHFYFTLVDTSIRPVCWLAPYVTCP